MFFIKLLIVALLHGRHHSLFHRHFFQNIEGNFLWIWGFHAGTKRSFLIETFKMNNKKERIIWSLKTNIELSMNNIIDQSIPGLYNLNSEHLKTLLPSKINESCQYQAIHPTAVPTPTILHFALSDWAQHCHWLLDCIVWWGLWPD